jgi:hypothetical protein
MSYTHDIEMTILCSILENQHYNCDKRILQVQLKEIYFTDAFHKKLVKGINRLIELEEPIDTDFLRLKFFEANKWTLQEDNRLIDIISKQPIATYNLYEKYYKQIVKNVKRLAL